MCIHIAPAAVMIINTVIKPVETKFITLANTDSIITINEAAEKDLLEVFEGVNNILTSIIIKTAIKINGKNQLPVTELTHWNIPTVLFIIPGELYAIICLLPLRIL